MDDAAARRDPFLGAAALASAALALLLVVAPSATGAWRVPLALVGGVWAPGYALLALLYPQGRLARLERHALAFALGLLLTPLVGLAASELARFDATQVALAGSTLTLGAAALAWRRARGPPEPAARSRLPGTRATLLATGAAFAFSGLLLLPAILVAEGAPSSLALTDAAGDPLDLRIPQGNATDALLHLSAGSAPASGTLLVTWAPLGKNATVLLERPVALAPGASERVPIELPTQARGTFVLEARWDGREVHARIRVEAGA